MQGATDVFETVEYSRDKWNMERVPRALLACMVGLIFVVYLDPKPAGPVHDAVRESVIGRDAETAGGLDQCGRHRVDGPEGANRDPNLPPAPRIAGRPLGPIEGRRQIVPRPSPVA